MKCSQNEYTINILCFFWEVISNGNVLEKIQKDNKIWKIVLVNYKNNNNKKNTTPKNKALNTR